MLASQIDLVAAKAELEEASAQSGINAELAEIKSKAVAQARAKIRIAENATTVYKHAAGPDRPAGNC